MATRCTDTAKKAEAFEYQWHSTPALWSAVRPSYDGAPDSHCKIGYGKTHLEAEADLIEQENGYCECGSQLVSEAEQRNAVCNDCL